MGERAAAGAADVAILVVVAVIMSATVYAGVTKFRPENEPTQMSSFRMTEDRQTQLSGLLDDRLFKLEYIQGPNLDLNDLKWMLTYEAPGGSGGYPACIAFSASAACTTTLQGAFRPGDTVWFREDSVTNLPSDAVVTLRLVDKESNAVVFNNVMQIE